MWIINIRHWLNDSGTEAAVPQLRNKVKKLTEIIAYATSVYANFSAPPVPKCWRRPKRKPCPGELDIFLDIDEKTIHYHCPVCRDEGVISGWEDLIWDMSGDNNGRTNDRAIKFSPRRSPSNR